MELWLFLIGLLVIFAISLAAYFYTVSTTAEPEKKHTHEKKDAPQDISGSRDISGTEFIIRPYSKNPIDNLDDYEYSMIFKNEGDRAMTKHTRDFLMSQYPKDWTTQPPSSDLFQQGLQAYKEAFANATPLPTTTKYNQINGSSMTPPDSMGQEMKEREILQTYVPKDPQSLTTYDADDAKTLIDKIYGAKGLVATYKQSGDNQFIITSTRPANQPIVYEEEENAHAVASAGPVASAGEETIIVPNIQPTGGLDPFFEPGDNSRDGRWDYTKFTPGLERMFAPTEPLKNWY
jgi:hypothetical protein